MSTRVEMERGTSCFLLGRRAGQDSEGGRGGVHTRRQGQRNRAVVKYKQSVVLSTYHYTTPPCNPPTQLLVRAFHSFSHRTPRDACQKT